MRYLSLHTLVFGASLMLVSNASAQIEIQPRGGEPVSGLNASQLDRFFKGQTEFAHILDVGEGLGPIFNDSSCAQCHSNPTNGGASTITVTRFGVAAVGMTPFDPLDNLGGSLLQKSSSDLACEEFVPVQADVVIQRQTPSCFGAGLLEAVADVDIAANEVSQMGDVNVHGFVRMNSPVEGGPDRAGRFGWKGGVSTVLTFSADASLNELGLTNRFFGLDNVPNGPAGDPTLIALCDSVMDPEDGPDIEGFDRIDRQTDFQRFLAAPPQTPRSGMTGEAVFNSVGCATCHVPTYTTGLAAEAALSNVEIHPYGDFLLHDMGGLGDGIVDGPATESIMMTRALWGMGQRDALLHDGRSTGGSFAQNVDSTIQEHAGEGAASRAAYNALSQNDKDALASFLLSLGRPEFDIENDNDVDAFDWAFLEFGGWFMGPGATITPDEEGAVADIDQDQDFDMVDFAYLQRAFSGQ